MFVTAVCLFIFFFSLSLGALALAEASVEKYQESVANLFFKRLSSFSTLETLS